jgi:hypothetical protein
VLSGLARDGCAGAGIRRQGIRSGAAVDLEKPREAGVAIDGSGGQESGAGNDSPSRQAPEDPPGGS